MLLRSDGAVRFANPEELAHYGAGAGPAPIDVFERETFEETIFLGLRMNEGLNLAELRQRFSARLIVPTEDAARELIRDGLMIEHNGYWRLTLRGRLLSNDVFTNLLMGVAA